MQTPLKDVSPLERVCRGELCFLQRTKESFIKFSFQHYMKTEIAVWPQEKPGHFLCWKTQIHKIKIQEKSIKAARMFLGSELNLNLKGQNYYCVPRGVEKDYDLGWHLL